MKYHPAIGHRASGDCEGCGIPARVVDHCHRHNEVRADLCHSCNSWMARMDRNPQNLYALWCVRVWLKCPKCRRTKLGRAMAEALEMIKQSDKEVAR